MVSQVGNDVVLSGTGSVNLTGLTLGGEEFLGIPNTIAPGQIIIGSLIGCEYFTGLMGSYNAPFASGSSLAQGDTGPGFGIDNALEELLLPVGYVSNADLDSSSTYDNTTITALGLNPGIYSWSWAGGGVDLIILSSSSGGTTVPEPSTLATLALPLAALLLARRGQRVSC
jgi:hypothetical protein